MIGKIIELCARNKSITFLFIGALFVWGIYGIRNAPLDAIPDLSDVQVIVLTEWPGRSPDLVEDQITYPISSTLLAAPKVTSVRGQSFLGLSFVYVIFEDGTDMYWARSRVMEYLDSAKSRLPEGVSPSIGPDATGVGWVFEYALTDESGKHDVHELRTLQDWHLRYALESVDGVAEVATVGGFVKQYQVQLDPNKLLAYDIPLQKVVRAVRESNADVGGRIMEIAGHEHMVRGRGYIHSVSDIESIPVKVDSDGVPVFVRDVGVVTLGPDIRRGVAELDGKGETVGGIVVMRYGENALRVIDRVKKRLDELRATLPEGVHLVVTYDRSELIKRSVATLRSTLLEEMVIVAIIIFLFLFHARSALVAVITLPVGVVMAFIPMFYQGLTANIMSLGGIAVAIGAMVDASIVIIENVHKRLGEWEKEGRPTARTDVLIGAMQEVGPAIFFSLLVITVSFLPIFTLQGTGGRLFRPLAFTKTYSMAFASILAVTLTPALAVLLIRGRVRARDDDPINRGLVRFYSPVVRWVVRNRLLVVVGALSLVVISLPVVFVMTSPQRSEFMPPLNEGSILYMPTAPPGMSVTQAAAVLKRMDAVLMEFPEVEHVFGKIGRARTATDPAPLSMVETVVSLKPRSEWRKGLTWDGLIEEMNQKLQIPGMPNIWWMPIQTRTEMLSTGVRGQLGIKVFADTPEQIEAAAVSIEDALEDVRGTRSISAERATGGFFVDFEVKRENAARYGLRVGDVNGIVMSAIGGMNISETVDGRERYPVNVRYAREFRDNPEAVRRVLVSTPAGTHVPLEQIADIRFRTGPPMIRSEDGKLMSFVSIDVSKRSIPDYVEEAGRIVAERANLPAGVRVEWAGQFKYLQRAKKQLFVVVPLTLFVVLILLFLNTRSIVHTAFILLGVLVFGPVGAFWLLFLLGYNMSIAAWVGLIALLGLAAETGVVMLLFLSIAHFKHSSGGAMKTMADLENAIVEGAAQRVRPQVMTTLTTMIALLPILWSAGTGADVMKRIAAPMVGGLVSAFLLTLVVFPALFALWKERELEVQD